LGEVENATLETCRVVYCVLLERSGFCMYFPTFTVPMNERMASCQLGCPVAEVNDRTVVRELAKKPDWDSRNLHFVSRKVRFPP